MRRLAGLTIGLVALGLAGCGPETRPALIVELESSLEIGVDTNSIALRIRRDESLLYQVSHALGDPPRDAWPQTVPIVSNDEALGPVTLEVELLWTEAGMPSATVGFTELTITVPTSGADVQTVVVPRACDDADGDTYGEGFGCRGPDCDEGNADIPARLQCPDWPLGSPGDMCGAFVCNEDQTCFDGQCLQTCVSNSDCGESFILCFRPIGVCVCRLPCTASTSCGPYQCREGCCQPT